MSNPLLNIPLLSSHLRFLKLKRRCKMPIAPHKLGIAGYFIGRNNQIPAYQSYPILSSQNPPLPRPISVKLATASIRMMYLACL